jgi:5-methyltetrahydrofolate--homocysteine methyltransferase
VRELLTEIARAVELGKADRSSPYPAELADRDGVAELTGRALAEGITATDVLNHGLVAGMKVVGDGFRSGSMFLPEVLMAARALSAGFEQLKPRFRSGEVRHKGTVLLGTVQGDLHDIGKKIVGLFFEGNGWRVVDLGVDCSPERFLAAIEEHRPAAVGLSTLLTTTMKSMADTCGRIKKERPDVRVIVGGAPITEEFARGIGADCYSPDPQGALDFLAGASTAKTQRE